MESKILGYIILIIFSIIGLVLVFNIIAGFISPIGDSSDQMAYPNNCSAGLDSSGTALRMNFTDLNCYNSSGSKLYTAGLYSLPLSGIFTRTGIAVAILMIGLFIGLIIFVFKVIKKT